MAKKGNRVQVILECTEHKESGMPGTSRYITTKNKKNTPDRMEIKKYNPITVYTTPYSDFHKDHQKIHECTLVATRPASSNVKHVLSYEISGTVKATYIPTIFEEISKELGDKIKAFKHYTTEIKKFPHPRSIESIKNLATHRGIESGLKKAEAFTLIRSIND